MAGADSASPGQCLCPPPDRRYPCPWLIQPENRYMLNFPDTASRCHQSQHQAVPAPPKPWQWRIDYANECTCCHRLECALYAIVSNRGRKVKVSIMKFRTREAQEGQTNNFTDTEGEDLRTDPEDASPPHTRGIKGIGVNVTERGHASSSWNRPCPPYPGAVRYTPPSQEKSLATADGANDAEDTKAKEVQVRRPPGLGGVARLSSSVCRQVATHCLHLGV